MARAVQRSEKKNMEGTVANSPVVSASFNFQSTSVRTQNYQADALVLEATFSVENSDATNVGVSFQDLYKGLSVTARQIVDKINELLKAKLPDGVQSLQPEDVTPEATAEKIVTGATAFFDAYAKQHPELEGEDLLTSFMDTIRGGIDRGYSDAFDTLKGLGAFDIDGVQSGIEKTKTLIEEKLKAYEEFKRQEMGLTAEEDIPDQIAEKVTQEVVTQAGAKALHVMV